MEAIAYMAPKPSGLYYLQSRYYAPTIGRFINADGYIATGQDILGNNMFAYCGNNPIIRADHFGDAFTDIVAVYLGQGDASEKPSKLCIPNAKRTDTWQDMIEVTVDYFQEVIESEPAQGIMTAGNLVSGAYDFGTGLIALYTPDPVPVIDEIKNLWTMIDGLINVMVGVTEIIASITWEENK